MKKNTPPVISFAGPSNSGKTTLITRLVTILQAKGYQLGVIKHTPHGWSQKTKAKDSDKYIKAGAAITCISDDITAQIIVPVQGLNPWEHSIFLSSDLILVEGYKSAPLPKIEVRPDPPREALFMDNDPHLMAIITNTKAPAGVPVFSHADADLLAIFIEQHITPDIK